MFVEHVINVLFARRGALIKNLIWPTHTRHHMTRGLTRVLFAHPVKGIGKACHSKLCCSLRDWDAPLMLVAITGYTRIRKTIPSSTKLAIITYLVVLHPSSFAN